MSVLGDASNEERRRDRHRKYDARVIRYVLAGNSRQVCGAET